MKLDNLHCDAFMQIILSSAPRGLVNATRFKGPDIYLEYYIVTICVMSERGDFIIFLSLFIYKRTKNRGAFDFEAVFRISGKNFSYMLNKALSAKTVVKIERCKFVQSSLMCARLYTIAIFPLLNLWFHVSMNQSCYETCWSFPDFFFDWFFWPKFSMISSFEIKLRRIWSLVLQIGHNLEGNKFGKFYDSLLKGSWSLIAISPPRPMGDTYFWV